MAIILIHRGNSLYLIATLLQARQSNPDSRIVLIGDRSNLSANKHLLERLRVEHCMIDDYFAEARQLAGIYRHLSGNDREYELFCFQRWFVLLELVRALGIDSGVYIDSDVLLYAKVNEVLSGLTTEMSVCNVVGPQYTFFKTPDVIAEYTAFIRSVFTDEGPLRACLDYVERRQDSGLPWLSDMVTLGVFAEQKRLADIGLVDESDPLFCENVSCSEGVELGYFGKRVVWRKGRPYFRRLTTGALVRAGGVHLQGKSKNFVFVYAAPRLRAEVAVRTLAGALRRAADRGRRAASRRRGAGGA